MTRSGIDDDLGAAASRGAGVTLLAQSLRVTIQLVSIVVLARLLSPRDFGLVAIVISVVGIAEVFRDFGLSTAAIQAPTLSSDERTNLFWANLGLGLVCSILTALAAPAIGAAFDEPRLVPLTMALAVVFLLNGATTQLSANIARNLRFQALALVSVLAPMTGVAAALLLATAGFEYWALVWQQIVAALTLFIATLFLNKWLPGLPTRRAPITRFLRFGSATVASKTLSHVAKNIDTISLGLVATPQVVGYYSKAQEVVSAPLDQINTPMTRVALPILSRVQADSSRFQRYTEKSQLVACYVTATGLAFLAGAADPFVATLLGAQWSAVGPILLILAVGGIFRSMAQVSYWVYLARGLVGPQLKLYTFTQGIIITLIVVGIPWGAVGIAVGATTGYIIFWLAGLWHIPRVSDVETKSLFRRSILVMVTLAAPIGLLSKLAAEVPVDDWVRLLVALFAAALWCCLAVLTVPAVRRDVIDLRNLAMRSLQRR